MNCQACGKENPDGNQFCGGCGNALRHQCSDCGKINPPDHLFCGGCGGELNAAGAPLTPGTRREPAAYTPKHLAEKVLKSRSALEGERKQVTVLFADVKGSTQLTRELDPESWHQILDQFFSILTEGVHRYEGTVNQYTGDGIMALFGAPIAHEDHAQRACFAAIEIRNKLREWADQLRLETGVSFEVRMGLNSGDVVVGKIGDDLRMDYTAQGTSVATAQRIEQLTEAGCVYLGESTERLARAYFDLRRIGTSKLKGLDKPVAIYELLAIGKARSRLDVSRARGFARFVGREREMSLLETSLDRVRQGHGQVIGVVGDPGLGKSRLCFEFIKRCRASGISVYEAHCPAHGKTISLLPIKELLRAFFDVSPDDSPDRARAKIAGSVTLIDRPLQNALPILFDFLGIAPPSSEPQLITREARERLLVSVILGLIEARNRRGLAVVIAIDDLHWIDPGSDAYIAHIIEAVDGTNTMLLVNFRPEYDAMWTHKTYYQQLPLVPLAADHVRQLLFSLLGNDPSLGALVDRIHDATGGNPFFAEEVMQMTIETGVLSGDAGHYKLSTPIERLEVPETVQSIIAARIDRLEPLAKRVVQHAAVIGKTFELSVLERIVGLTADELKSSLEILKQREFIHEHSLYPAIEYGFKHALSYQVAYDTQLAVKRTAIHARIAALLQELHPDRLDHESALIAHHYDCANDYKNAIAWHERAARWTLMKDTPSSLRHWKRLRELADGVPDEAEMLEHGASACAHILDLDWQLGASEQEAARFFEDGLKMADRAGDLAAQARLIIAYAGIRGLNLGMAEDNIALAGKAVELSDELGDPLLQGSARMSLANGLVLAGRFAKAGELTERALTELPPDESFVERGVSPRPTLLALRALSHHFTDANPAQAHHDLETACEIATQRGFVEIEVYLHSLFTWFAVLKGDSARACQHAHAATEIANALGTGLARCHGLLAQGRAHLVSNDSLKAREYFAEMVRVAGETRAGGALVGSALAGLAAALLTLNEPDQARDRTDEAVNYVRARKLAWDLMPWITRADVLINADDRLGGRQALSEADALIRQTGAVIFRPFLHEARAAYAARFKEPWDPEAEREAASESFAQLDRNGPC